MDEDLYIQKLVQKYIQAYSLGKKLYLDAEEFALLAEYYNILNENDRSVKLIDEGLAMHPTSPELMLLKAKTLVYSEQYVEAMSYIQNLTEEDGIDVVLLKIECLLHQKQFDEVRRLYAKMLDKITEEEDSSGDQIVLTYFITELGYLYNDVDKFDEAIILLEEGIKLEHNPDVLVDLAYAYEMKGDFEKAIEYNNQLLDADPYSFDGWVNIGKLYSMCDQFDKAINAFDFALTIRENNPSTLRMKALSMYLNGNTEEAVRLFESCMSESELDEPIYDSLLEAYDAMEEYDEMLKLLDKQEQQFGTAGIAIKRSFVYLSKEDLPNATHFFEQVPENEKETLDYYILEGELAFYNNDFLQTEISFLKAAVISEDNEDIIDRLAGISIVQEKFEQAAQYFEQLLEISPDFPMAKMRLAFTRFEIGQKEPFEELLEGFSDDELHSMLQIVAGENETEMPKLPREKILLQLNEARENRILYRNMRY